MLTNTAYIGYVIFNRRNSRTGEIRPETEWVPIPVPPIITEEEFHAVRKQLADRDPRMGKAAVKTNTNLLTKIAICGCGGDGCGADEHRDREIRPVSLLCLCVPDETGN
ncbi:MAG TPA: recombinase family protein [Sphingomonas sp.]|nr:recombinase family protein [Sphingomonas sp.]